MTIDRFFWPQMAMEIQSYIQNCERYIRFKQQPHQAEMVSIDASYPLQIIHMDFLQIGSKKDKNNNVLVVTDNFTRYSQAYVTLNQQAATVVKVFIDKFVTNYGWPEKILMDQGLSFEGALFKELCSQARIRKMRTTPYHPMTNGQSERFNRTLLTMIGTLPPAAKSDWQKWVNQLVHTYNCTKSQVTGYSPFFLMFGREPRTPVDEEFEVTFPFRKEKNIREYVQKLRERLNWAFNLAKEHMDKDAIQQKLYYDRKYHCMEVVPGDIVLIRQKVYGATHKIEDQWELLVYKVLEKHDDLVYTVQRIGETGDKLIRKLHRNMLYPFVSLMGGDGGADTAVEVTDPVVPPGQVETRMLSLIRANEFMDSYFDPDW